MGNAMLTPLKTKAEHLMQSLGEKLNTDFENNKKMIKSLNLPFSRHTINRISGYIVRYKKMKAKE